MSRSLIVTGIVLCCLSASQAMADVRITDWMYRGSNASRSEYTIATTSLIDMNWLRFRDIEYLGCNSRCIEPSGMIAGEFKETVILASVQANECSGRSCQELLEKDTYRHHCLDIDSSTTSGKKDAYARDIINDGLGEKLNSICSYPLSDDYLNVGSDFFQQNPGMNVEFRSYRSIAGGRGVSSGYGSESVLFILLLIGVGVPVALRQLFSR